jgi:hypothetical protein
LRDHGINTTVRENYHSQICSVTASLNRWPIMEGAVSSDQNQELPVRRAFLTNPAQIGRPSSRFQSCIFIADDTTWAR